jgi:hypothetical protein
MKIAMDAGRVNRTIPFTVRTRLAQAALRFWGAAASQVVYPKGRRRIPIKT